MKSFVAIDGGGTKTDFVLFDAAGHVLRRVLASGCNPNDFGWSFTERVLREGLCCLLQSQTESPDAIFAGVSGGSVGDNRAVMHALLKKLVPDAAFLDNDSDAVSALSCGLLRNDGGVVISGTGSVAFARTNGQIERIGGWGYLFDRGGSGYDFGRDAVYYALCATDGRGHATLLTDLLCDALGMPVGQAVPTLYAQGKPAIAALAPLVFVAARRCDEIAGQILQNNAAELAKLFNALAKRVDGPVCKTVLAGSVFRDWEMFYPYLRPLLSGAHEFILPTLPPVYGSAVETLARAGVTQAQDFEANFSTGLAVCPIQPCEVSHT